MADTPGCYRRAMTEQGTDRVLTRPDLDLQTLRIARALEQTGSITGAARLLGLSQPAISQHLHRAEARIGQPIVRRRGRTIRLTEAGRILSEASPGIEAQLDEVAAALGRLASLEAGSVSVAGFPSSSSTLIPTLLDTLARTRPGLRISYVEAEPPQALELLRGRSVDLAIVCAYPDDPIDHEELLRAGLLAVPLFADRMMLLLADGHPLADESEIGIADLEDDEWIAGCPECRGHVVAACRSAGFSPRIFFETDNVTAVLGLVAKGLGVAILPQLSLATAVIPRGAIVRETSPGSARTIYLAMSVDAVQAPAVHVAATAIQSVDGSPWALRRVLLAAAG